MKRAAKALIRDDQGRILVLYRSKTHPRLAHDIDLPGGEIEHFEQLERGMRRELQEETGLDLVFKRRHRIHVWRPARVARRYHLYELSLDTEQPVSISWEHESYRWISDQEFIEHPAIDGFMHTVQEWLREQSMAQ